MKGDKIGAMRLRLTIVFVILLIVFIVVIKWNKKRPVPRIPVPIAIPVPATPAKKIIPRPVLALPRSSSKKVLSPMAAPLPSSPVTVPSSVSPVVPPSPVAPVPAATVVVPPSLAPEPQEWQGNNDTAITRAGQIVVQTDQQWIRFWAEHHPDEAAPEVDFSRYRVVGVFLGQRPADSFAVHITGIRPVADAVMIDYLELDPPPGTLQINVTAFPYDIKVIPRSPLKVKFNKLTPQYQRETATRAKTRSE